MRFCQDNIHSKFISGKPGTWKPGNLGQNRIILSSMKCWFIFTSIKRGRRIRVPFLKRLSDRDLVPFSFPLPVIVTDFRYWLSHM